MFTLRDARVCSNTIQSDRLSVQTSELGPSTRKCVLPPSLGPRGETHSLAGVGGFPIPTKGQTL